jgi:hypothetical protein
MADMNKQEALAYTLAANGNLAQAEEHLRDLLSRLDRNISWQSEMGQRAELMQQELAQGTVAVKQLLAVWKAETLRNLRLQNTR